MVKTAKKKPGSSGVVKKTIRVIIILLVGGFLIMLSELYRRVYYPNINLKERTTTFLYIHTGASYRDVLEEMSRQNLLKNQNSFDWLARQVDYPNHIHPGKYLIAKTMSNKDLVWLLHSGRQTPVKLIFNNIRTTTDLAGRFSHQLEPDSLQLLNLFNDEAFLSQYDVTPNTVMALFIPNTYEMYWNTSAENLLRKMYLEYQRFWTDKNKELAKKIGLTPIEVSIMASIVEQETRRDQEKPVVAGVYMNRLKRGLRLEADPTLVFALGDYSIKRVLNAYKALESPYNTYKYAGLPPGPICMPSVSSIQSVLHFQHHDFLFFCAKEDFSGFHVFAKNYAQHLQNARRYQTELNKRNIKI